MDTLNINYDDFNTNLCDGLQSIFSSSEMSDVTLAVEGKYLRAHQLILSMFSTYFRELFQVTPSRNTIFFMKNVKHRIMHNLLVFMYEGKVQIPTQDFQMFVDTANELKIKGLSNDVDLNAFEQAIEQVKVEQNSFQVSNADVNEHAIDSSGSIKRASQSMPQKAKKSKLGENVPVQATDQNDLEDPEEYDMDGIQLKDEDCEEADFVHYKEDDTMTMGNAEDENDSLVAIDSNPLPPPSKGIPVTISLCLTRATRKVKAVIWEGFRYSFKYECKLYVRWRCTGNSKCNARLHWAVKDGLITLHQSHNHGKSRIRINYPAAVKLESRNVYAVSNEYFSQHIQKRKSLLC